MSHEPVQCLPGCRQRADGAIHAAQRGRQQSGQRGQRGGPDGKPYRAKQVVFEAVPVAERNAIGVRVKELVEDSSPGRMIYDPRNPAADENGYVTMPNVSVVDEMVNMISASRSYQTNAEVMNTAKQLLLRTLTLGQ